METDLSPVCWNCSQKNPSGFRFCGQCGQPLGQSNAEEKFNSRPTNNNDHDNSSSNRPFPNEAKSSKQARLVLILEDGSEGGALFLDEGPQIIGRNHGPPFSEDVYLDGDHASLFVTDKGLLIDAQNTLNGIFVRMTSRVELHHCDHFRIGQELLLYEDIVEPTPNSDGSELLGSPNLGYWGRVSNLVAPELADRAIAIESDGITIGREVGEFLFPEDGYVSARHCQVFGNDDGVFLEDLDSSNGTYLRVRPNQLVEFGNLLLIGQQLFRLDS